MVESNNPPVGLFPRYMICMMCTMICPDTWILGLDTWKHWIFGYVGTQAPLTGCFVSVVVCMCKTCHRRTSIEDSAMRVGEPSFPVGRLVP